MKDGRGDGGQDLSERRCVHIQIPEEWVDLTGSEKGRRWGVRSGPAEESEDGSAIKKSGQGQENYAAHYAVRFRL